VEAVEHLLAVGLERRSEQVVEVRLVGEVNSGDGCRAGITLGVDETNGVNGCGYFGRLLSL